MKKIVLLSICVFTSILLAQSVPEMAPGYMTMKKEAYRVYESGHPSNAIRNVRAFLKRHPDSVHAKNLLAVLYYWQGEKRVARAILEEIVAAYDFPQAKRLLSRLVGSVAGAKQHAQQVQEPKHEAHPSTQKNSGQHAEDLAYLLGYARRHPEDLESRKFLLQYYLSVSDRAHAVQMAKEILSIDPDERETLKVVAQEDLVLPKSVAKAVQPSDERDRMAALLARYKTQKAYHRYINLYQTLLDRGEYLPRYVHLEALEIAIAEREYSLAKRILMQNRFQPTPHLHRLRALLDQKLKTAFLL